MSSLRAIRPEACTFPARNIHSVFRRFRANTFAQSRSARDVRPMVVSPGNKRRWIAVPGCNTGQHTCRLVAFFGLRHFLVRSRLRFSLKRHNRQGPRHLPSPLRQSPRTPPHQHPSSIRSISTRRRQRNSIRSRKLAPRAPRPLSRLEPKASSRTGTISLPARSSRRTLRQRSRTWSASDLRSNWITVRESRKRSHRLRGRAMRTGVLWICLIFTLLVGDVLRMEQAVATELAQAGGNSDAARRQAEEAQRRQAEEAQHRQAEEQRRHAEEAQRRQAEEQRRHAEDAQRRQTEEAQRRHAEEAQRRQAEEQRRRAEEVQ